MKKWMKIFIIIGGLLIFALLGLVFMYGPNYNIYLVPPSPKRYGEIALNKMENGLYASGEKWEQAKSSALEELSEATEYQDAYPILEEAIKVAGGKHSFIVYPENEQPEATIDAMPTLSVEDNILILNLPAFAGSDMEANQQYAKILNQALYSADFSGVIINLTDNSGGDMGPMVSGLSSLIPDGLVMTFEYRNGITHEVALEEGTVTGGGTSVTLEETGKIPEIPVAVIINHGTASSGEMVALAFKGLDKVRFFGEASASYTSGNSQMTLYDGTIMQLTTSAVIDRTGMRYENNPIEPDVLTDDPLEAAKTWIQSSEVD